MYIHNTLVWTPTTTPLSCSVSTAGNAATPAAEVRLATDRTHARLLYRGAVCDDSVDRLQYFASVATDYYHYREVCLQLDSPGGSAPAVMRWLAWSRHWRQTNGVRLHTEALAQASSAAAMMLSAGEWGCRRARPDTLLLYHNARALLPAALTGSGAAHLTAQLRRLDAQLPLTLLHTPLHHCGREGLARALLARARWLRAHWAELPERLRRAGAAHVQLPATTPEWVNVLLKPGDEAQRLHLLMRRLHAVLQRDAPMSPLQAWAWGLLDEVIDVLPFIDAPHPQPQPCPEDTACEADVSAPMPI